MSQQFEPADPIVKGTFATAKQSVKDLFRWKQRVEITNEYGESMYVWQSPAPLRNPISLFAQLSASQWLFFLVGLGSWMADAFDFHALSIQTTKLAKYYDTSKTNITSAITLTLLLRSVGAAIFGLLADRFGRKYPMVINMIILGLLQIGTIYAKTFNQFLGVRAVFGLFMGGVYGSAIAMALENCPTDARGLMSGILQQGYSLGYVIAAVSTPQLLLHLNLTDIGSAAIWELVVALNPGRPSSGLVQAFPSLWVWSDSAFPSRSSSLKPNVTRRRIQSYTRTQAQRHSGLTARRCLPRSGACAFTAFS